VHRGLEELVDTKGCAAAHCVSADVRDDMAHVREVVAAELVDEGNVNDRVHWSPILGLREALSTRSAELGCLPALPLPVPSPRIKPKCLPQLGLRAA
jgi:hypothetical protein